MNQKKSKALRIIVKQMIKKEVLSGPHAVYGTMGNTKRLAQDTVQTVMLDPKCPRGVYRRMKKYGVASVLQGLA